jgi:hypothetical protein
MKLSLVFSRSGNRVSGVLLGVSALGIAGAMALGCATGVAYEEPTPSGTAKKDAGVPDAKSYAKPDSGSLDNDSGTNDPPIEQDSGGPNNCSLQIGYGGQTCQTCMAGGCCAQDNACAYDNDCVALINCLNPCVNTANQQACSAACRGQHATGAQLFDGIVTCMSSQCANDCP